jgi:hypothetical protein
MPAIFSNATWQTALTETAVPGIMPGSVSDGECTWAVVGMSADGSVLVFAVVGPFGPSDSRIVTKGNTLEAPMVPHADRHNCSYIKVNLKYEGPNDKNFWKVFAGRKGATACVFVRGTGAGH